MTTVIAANKESQTWSFLSIQSFYHSILQQVIMSACQEFIDIFKLLKAALYQVDAKTVLLSERVSTRFRDTIIGSTLLQEKLVFRQPPADPDEDQRDSKTSRNPLLPWRTNGVCPSISTFMGFHLTLASYHIRATRLGGSAW